MGNRKLKLIKLLIVLILFYFHFIKINKNNNKLLVQLYRKLKVMKRLKMLIE